MAAIGPEHARLGHGHLCWVRCRGHSAILTQGLKLCLALLILLVFQYLGELGVQALTISLPGPLLGMLMLLGVLTVYDRPLEFLDKTSNVLIQNLSLMFIPPSVGAFFLSAQIYQQFPSLLSTILLSTVGGILFLALLVKLLLYKAPRFKSPANRPKDQ